MIKKYSEFIHKKECTCLIFKIQIVPFKVFPVGFDALMPAFDPLLEAFLEIDFLYSH